MFAVSWDQAELHQIPEERGHTGRSWGVGVGAAAISSKVKRCLGVIQRRLGVGSVGSPPGQSSQIEFVAESGLGRLQALTPCPGGLWRYSLWGRVAGMRL